MQNHKLPLAVESLTPSPNSHQLVSCHLVLEFPNPGCKKRNSLISIQKLQLVAFGCLANFINIFVDSCVQAESISGKHLLETKPT